MNRCAGQSTTEFMLMVVLMVGMAVIIRLRFWEVLPVLHGQIVGHVAGDGRLIR